MIEFAVTVKDPLGIHARPAGKIVSLLSKYDSFVTVWKDGKEYDAKKLLSLMGTELACGETVIVRVEGSDETICAAASRVIFDENL